MPVYSDDVEEIFDKLIKSRPSIVKGTEGFPPYTKYEIDLLKFDIQNNLNQGWTAEKIYLSLLYSGRYSQIDDELILY